MNEQDKLALILHKISDEDRSSKHVPLWGIKSKVYESIGRSIFTKSKNGEYTASLIILAGTNDQRQTFITLKDFVFRHLSSTYYPKLRFIWKTPTGMELDYNRWNVWWFSSECFEKLTLLHILLEAMCPPDTIYQRGMILHDMWQNNHSWQEIPVIGYQFRGNAPRRYQGMSLDIVESSW